MGLAASQGRFLCLTARNNDLVYEGQQISQQRVALAKQTQEVASKYSKAMNNQVMQITLLNEKGAEQTERLTYDLLTLGKKAFGGGLGLRLIDENGNVVIPGDFVDVTTRDGDKESVTTRYHSVNDFISKCMPDLDSDTIASFGTSLTTAVQYYQNSYARPEGSNIESVQLTNTDTYRNSGIKTLTDPNCLDPDYLQNMLETAQWSIEKEEIAGSGEWKSYVWEGSSDIHMVLNTIDDAGAAAEYEDEMAELNWRDKVLELRLEEVETEQSAVEKELDSVKKIIDKNIEDSFKTFSG